jgi:hypothetical protein
VTFGDWTFFPPGATTGTIIGTGGSASGSFDYLANGGNGIYSNVSVSTTPWVTSSVLYTPTPDTVSVNNGSGLGLWDGSSSSDSLNISFLFLVFKDPTNPLAPDPDPLTNAGGKRSISLTTGDSMEFICLDSACSTFDERPVTGGGISGVAVVTPEPAAFSLLGIGLLALLIGSAIRKVVSA